MALSKSFFVAAAIYSPCAHAGIIGSHLRRLDSVANVMSINASQSPQTSSLQDVKPGVSQVSDQVNKQILAMQSQAQSIQDTLEQRMKDLIGGSQIKDTFSISQPQSLALDASNVKSTSKLLTNQSAGLTGGVNSLDAGYLNNPGMISDNSAMRSLYPNLRGIGTLPSLGGIGTTNGLSGLGIGNLPSLGGIGPTNGLSGLGIGNLPSLGGIVPINGLSGLGIANLPSLGGNGSTNLVGGIGTPTNVVLPSLANIYLPSVGNLPSFNVSGVFIPNIGNNLQGIVWPINPNLGGLNNILGPFTKVNIVSPYNGNNTTNDNTTSSTAKPSRVLNEETFDKLPSSTTLQPSNDNAAGLATNYTEANVGETLDIRAQALAGNATGSLLLYNNLPNNDPINPASGIQNIMSNNNLSSSALQTRGSSPLNSVPSTVGIQNLAINNDQTDTSSLLRSAKNAATNTPNVLDSGLKNPFNLSQPNVVAPTLLSSNYPSLPSGSSPGLQNLPSSDNLTLQNLANQVSNQVAQIQQQLSKISLSNPLLLNQNNSLLTYPGIQNPLLPNIGSSITSQIPPTNSNRNVSYNGLSMNYPLTSSNGLDANALLIQSQANAANAANAIQQAQNQLKQQLAQLGFKRRLNALDLWGINNIYGHEYNNNPLLNDRSISLNSYQAKPWMDINQLSGPFGSLNNALNGVQNGMNNINSINRIPTIQVAANAYPVTSSTDYDKLERHTLGEVIDTIQKSHLNMTDMMAKVAESKIDVNKIVHSGMTNGQAFDELIKQLALTKADANQFFKTVVESGLDINQLIAEFAGSQLSFQKFFQNLHIGGVDFNKVIRDLVSAKIDIDGGLKQLRNTAIDPAIVLYSPALPSLINSGVLTNPQLSQLLSNIKTI